MAEATVVSCPGKVLLGGGYLVLDPRYVGFVVSTPSRFYTVVQEDLSAPVGGDDEFTITVRSPQFTDGNWKYQAKKDEKGEWRVKEVVKDGSSSNSFVFLSISSSLLLSSAILQGTKHRSLLITIVGSNDFYSQSRTDANPIPFAPLNTTIRDVHKTGLGSSAAMVTSLVSSLFLHWTSPPTDDPAHAAAILSASPPLPSSFTRPSDRPQGPDKATTTLVHNLAQYVHSLAQGKVGSGFDVSAAVWGSQVYRRFAVECIGELLERKDTDGEVSSVQLLKTLSPLLNHSWTNSATSAMVSSFALPPRVVLILADVDAGSNTPSMVGKVLAWRKKSPAEAEEVWESLNKSNSSLAASFGVLTRLENESPEEYAEAVAQLSAVTSGKWTSKIGQAFVECREHILTTRKFMRRMGEASDVPIEPPSQTKLLDACSALPGVIGAGVPGAGGYDAIWVLALSPSASSSSSPEEGVAKLMKTWTEMSVQPLSKTAWARGGQQDGEKGLLRETFEGVDGLKEAVRRR
ncbi:Phosphomevalonate kinase [Meredithblackwellia eburnea MCA 4105]